MPRQRITREMVVEAAFELVREGGLEQVQVKNIAQKLGCSVQPIYSYCASMEGLRKELEDRTARFVREYVAAHTDPDNLFQSTGFAYIHLAIKEPDLYRLYFLRRREGISSLDDLYRNETNPALPAYLAEQLRIPVEQAKEVHLSMLVHTLGIGYILTAAKPGISEKEAQQQLIRAYEIFLRYAQEGAIQ